MGPVSTTGVYDFRKLKDANNSAQQRSQDLGPGKLVLACGKVVEQTPGKIPKAPRSQRNDWKLRVVLQADGGGYPPGLVNVVVTNSGNAFGNMNVTFPASTTSGNALWNNSGRKLLQVKVNHPGWSQANQSFTIDDGDDKLVLLRIKRNPWVAFRVFDQKANNYIGGLPMNFALPGGPQAGNSLQLTPLEFPNLIPVPDTADIVSIGAQDNTAVWVGVAIRQED